MSKRTILIVALSIVFGLSAAVGAARLTNAGVSEPAEMVAVVIVADDLPRFTVLAAEHVKVQQYPKEFVPPGAVSAVEDAAGRVVDTPLVKGEPLLESKLASKGAGRGLAAVIPKGMRAVTIQTPNVATGVAGFIMPGNKVDVMFTRQTHKAEDATGGGATRTLVPNVEILAVDQRIEAPTNNKVDAKELKSVTLLVTPDQAAEIDLAQTVGTLHLTLRSPLDTDTTKSARATLKGIESGRDGMSAEEFATLIAAMFKGPASAPIVAKELTPIEVAPTPVVEKPAAPVPPPRIRTLRGGIPNTVYIE